MQNRYSAHATIMKPTHYIVDVLLGDPATITLFNLMKLRVKDQRWYINKDKTETVNLTRHTDVRKRNIGLQEAIMNVKIEVQGQHPTWRGWIASAYYNDKKLVWVQAKRLQVKNYHLLSYAHYMSTVHSLSLYRLKLPMDVKYRFYIETTDGRIKTVKGTYKR